MVNVVARVEGYPTHIEFLVVKTATDVPFELKVILRRPFVAATRENINFEKFTFTLLLPNASPKFDMRG